MSSNFYNFLCIKNLLVVKVCEHLHVFSQCMPFCQDSVERKHRKIIPTPLDY